MGGDQGPVPFAMGTQQDSHDFVAAVDFVTSFTGYENASISVTGLCCRASVLPDAFALKDGLASRANVKAIAIIQPGTWGQFMRRVMKDAMVDEINRQLIEAGTDDMDMDSKSHTASYQRVRYADAQPEPPDGQPALDSSMTGLSRKDTNMNFRIGAWRQYRL